MTASAVQASSGKIHIVFNSNNNSLNFGSVKNSQFYFITAICLMRFFDPK